MKKSVVACWFAGILGAGLLSLPAAAQIYQWKDENGVTHFSDHAPPGKASGAKQMTLRGTNVSEENRKEAEARAAREQAAATRKPNPPEKAVANSPASDPVPQKPVPGKGASREERMAPFRESQECFQQYRLVGGGIRAEAFEKCGPELKEPSREP